MRPQYPFLILVLAAIMVVSACGAQPSRSGVYGLAVVENSSRSAASPSPLPDDFGSTVLGQFPDPHAVVVIMSAGQHPDKIVARVVAGADGTFRVTLPPGNYTVRGKNMPSFFAVPAPVKRDVYVRLIVPTKEL